MANPKNDYEYSLDLPQREGTDGFVGTFFTLYLKLATILQSPEFSKEPIRVYYLSEFIISLVPDSKHRERIRAEAKAYRTRFESEYIKNRNISKLTSEIENHILIQTSINSLGLVTDYIDEHIGLSKQHKVFFRKSELTEKTATAEPES